MPISWWLIYESFWIFLVAFSHPKYWTLFDITPNRDMCFLSVYVGGKIRETTRYSLGLVGNTTVKHIFKHAPTRNLLVGGSFRIMPTIASR